MVDHALPALSSADARNPARAYKAIVALVVIAVVYNGVLAAINASVMKIGFGHVVAVETAVILFGLLYCLWRGLFIDDVWPVLFLLYCVLITVALVVFNRLPVVDFLRNMLILLVFAMLGMRANQATVVTAFRISCITVLAVLLVEIFIQDFFENFFYPAQYYRDTRGLEQIEFGGSKLFQNSIKIEGRFSFGLLDHRSVSIFLEQVSLANFSGVLLVYILTFFDRMRLWERVMALGTIILILVTNDTRTMLIFSGVCLVGYFIFPKLPSQMTLLTLPLILFAGALVAIFKPDASGDTLDGRVVLTIKNLLDMDLMAMLGLEVTRANDYLDSGYVWVVYSGTVFSMLALWAWISLFPAGTTPAQRRCAWGLSVFIFMNLLIGGNAIFSIKISALLWLLVGFMRTAEASRATRPVRLAA